MSKCTCRAYRQGAYLKIDRCATCVENERIADAARAILGKYPYPETLYPNVIGVSNDELWNLVRASLSPDQAQGEVKS